MNQTLGTEGLVIQLVRDEILRTAILIKVFRAVDRKDFVLPKYRSDAYEDIPLPIGHGQTISQPTVVAIMLELLSPQAGERILDVDSGSGWTTALLGTIVGSAGRVWGLERIPELVTFGAEKLRKYKLPQAEILQAGRIIGLPARAPFDRILVSAAAPQVPTELLDQLKVGGVLVMPIGHDVWKIHKISEHKTTIEKFFGFSFVPLIEEEK